MRRPTLMRRVIFLAALIPMLTVISSRAAIPPKISQFPEGERLIYTRLLEAFHRNELPEVVKQRQVLERNYPNSIHLDNAYYLNGMLEYQSNRLGEAIKSFAVVKDRFVKSNKRPSALFGMAVTSSPETKMSRKR